MIVSMTSKNYIGEKIENNVIYFTILLVSFVVSIGGQMVLVDKLNNYYDPD